MPRRLHRVTEVILIIVLSEVALIITAQSNTRSFINGLNNQNGGRTQYINQRSQLKNTTNGYHIDLDLGLCREGWVKGHMRNVPVCIRLNKEPLTWRQSRDQCRLDKAFLVKLETPVTVGSRDIRDFLRRRNVNEFWSGLHIENDHFVWDELAPHIARAYNDELESRLETERIWQWTISDKENEDKSEENSDQTSANMCGKISIPKVENRRRKRSIKRNKRQTEDLIDNLEYPSQNAHNEGMPNHEFSQIMQPQKVSRNNINNLDIDSPIGNIDGIPGNDFSHVIQSQNGMDTNLMVTSSREIADPTIASMPDLNQNNQNKQSGFQQQIQAYIQSNGQKFQERLNKRIQNTGMTQPQILQLLKQMQQTIRNSRDSLLDDHDRQVDNHPPSNSIKNIPVNNNFRMPNIDRRPVSAISMMNTNTGRASTPVMHSPTGPNMKRLSDDFLKRTTNPVMGNIDIDTPDMDTENIMELWNRRNPISKILKDKTNASPTQIAFPKEEANNWIQKFRTTVGDSEIENAPTQIPLIQGTSDLDSESAFRSIKPSSLLSETDAKKTQIFDENQEDTQKEAKSVTKIEKESDNLHDNEWQSEARTTKESGPLPPEPDSLVTIMPPPFPVKSINQNLRNFSIPTTSLPETTKTKIEPQSMTTEEDMLSGINFDALFDEIVKDEVMDEKENVSMKLSKQETQNQKNARTIIPEVLHTGERERDDIKDARDKNDNDEVKMPRETANTEVDISNDEQKVITPANKTAQLEVERKTFIDNIPLPTFSTGMKNVNVDLPSLHKIVSEVSENSVNEDDIMKSNSTATDLEEEVDLEEHIGINADLKSNETIETAEKSIKVPEIHDDEIDDDKNNGHLEALAVNEKISSNDTKDFTISDSHDHQGMMQTHQIPRKLIIQPTKDTVVLTDVVEDIYDDDKDVTDSDEDMEEARGGTVPVQKKTEMTIDDDDELLSSEEDGDDDIDELTDDNELSSIKTEVNTTVLNTNETSTYSSLFQSSDEDMFDRDSSNEDVGQNNTFSLSAINTTIASTSDINVITSESDDELHSSDDIDDEYDTAEKMSNSTKTTPISHMSFTVDAKTDDNDEKMENNSDENSEDTQDKDISDNQKHLTKVPVYEASSDYEFSEPRIFTETPKPKSYDEGSSSEKEIESNSLSLDETKTSLSDENQVITADNRTESELERDNEHLEAKEDKSKELTSMIPPILIPPPPIPRETEIESIDESSEKIEEAEETVNVKSNIVDEGELENSKEEDGFEAENNDGESIKSITITITPPSKLNEIESINEKDISDEDTNKADEKETLATKTYVEDFHENKFSEEASSSEKVDRSSSKDISMPNKLHVTSANITTYGSEEELDNTDDVDTSKEQDLKKTGLKDIETMRKTEFKVKDTDTESNEDDDKKPMIHAYEREDDDIKEELQLVENTTENRKTYLSEENDDNDDDISGENISSNIEAIETNRNDAFANRKEEKSSEEDELEKEEQEDDRGDSSDIVPHIVTVSSGEDASNVKEDSKEDENKLEDQNYDTDMNKARFNEAEYDSTEISEEDIEDENVRISHSFSFNMTNKLTHSSEDTKEEIEDEEEIKGDRNTRKNEINVHSTGKAVNSEESTSEEIESKEIDADDTDDNTSRVSNRNISREITEEEDQSMEENEYSVFGKNNSLHESNEVVDDDNFIDEISIDLEEHGPLLHITSKEQRKSSEETLNSSESKAKLREILQDDEISKSVERISKEVIEGVGWDENIENAPIVKIQKKRESGEQMEDFEYADENESHLKSEAASQDEYRQAEEQDLEPTGESQYVNDDVEYEPKDGNDGGVEQDDDWNDDTNSEMNMMGKASMEIEECDNTMSSMCFSYPITAEKGASTCGTDWYGHVFMDKCYRAIKDIDRIPYLNYQYGTKLCQALGGRIAEIRDGFGGKFIMLTLLKSMREFNMQGEPPGVWVNSEPIGTSCTMLTRSGPLAVSCDTNNMAVTICEKTAINPGLTLEHVRDHQHMMYPVYFYSGDANKELTCGLTGHATELPTLWFKDGRLIDIRVKKRLESVLPHQGGRPISPLPEPAESPTSSLILGSVLKKTLQRSTDQFLTDDVFQGTYWCEVWDLKPFRRHSSTPYIVRFSDVVTMVGTVHLPFIRNDDVILHDKIKKNVNTVRNVEFDLNFINSIILPSLRRAVPDIQEISTYAKEIIGTKPLTLKFHTYIKMSGNYSMATEIMIFRTLRRFYREVVRNPEVLLRLPRKTPLHLIRSMNVRSTVSCPQTLLTDTITGHSATFPSSAIGMKVDSFEICGGERSGQAFCTGDFSSGAYWTDVHIWKSCGQSLPPPPNTVNLKDSDEVDDTEEKEDDDNNDYDTLLAPMTPEERLKELAEMSVGEDNVEGVMEETADITESVEDLKELDVEYIAEIMRKTANTARIGKFVAAKAMRTVDMVLSMQQRRVIKSRKASQIIKNFEKIAEDAEIDDDSGHFRMVMSNIALDVYQLHRHKRPVLGFGAKAAQTRRMDSDFSPNRIFTIYDQTDMYRDVDVAIQLPSDLIDEATAGKRRLFMMVYKKGNLFQDESIPINVSGKVNVDGGHDLKLINSYVISASLGGKKIQGLSNKVKTIYRPLKNPDGRQRTCAFYDFAMNNLSGGWSSAGCVFNGTSNGREICLCDHMTNFAVLIDFYGQREPVEREHEETLSIISLIGLSLSILGLSLTIISYLFFRKLRQGRAQQTLFNLALAMLFSWVVFLVGIKQTYHYVACLIVAALLHYFILASFMWMLMEAFLQYLTFVKVLGTYVRRYTLKSVLVAWGLPAVPVISVLSIDYTLYKGGDQYCWMSLDAFYYAFAIPVGVIILSNLIVFVITVVSIYRRPAGLRSNQSKHKMAITNLQAAITSFVLLGLSWILGYFAISDARLPFHYAFTILNSLQGFFIFVIFVVRKKQVRDQWLIACCCKTPEQQKAQRSLSASASIPSTCSAKSTRSSSSTSSLQQRSRTDRSDSCQTTTSFISAEYDSIYALPYSKVSRDSLYYRKF